jgi:FKBP-type peptidyl-prolyl cis-trans isomerase SlyD
MTGQVVEFQKQSPVLRVARDRVVALEYVLYDADSNEVLEYRGDLQYLHGGQKGSLERVEQALEGKRSGDREEVTLEPAEAYGEHDPGLVISDRPEAFPAEARVVGARLDGEAPDGSVVQFRVVEVSDERITVDGNHPYAGMRLRFLIEIHSVRPATAAELRDGYAHAGTEGAG